MSELQVRAYDWCAPPKRIIRSKLATEMSKVVKRFIRVRPMFYWAELRADPSQNMQEKDIPTEHARWRVGPSGIQVKDLHLAALEQVSAGSWQVRLFYKPDD